ncbi:hypothetical protein L6452_15002 [Arctium lappa]|uniref:Uncharacterized protein n=1 Tax=Arctium lappa TaxID=4217 RepID=A0ACB9CME4_ARCLA|nr:hypothetical protein L6452_15002 [Arctium lappa]
MGWLIFVPLSPLPPLGGKIFSHDPILEFYVGYDYDESNQRVSLQLYNNHYDLDLDRFATLLGLPHSDHCLTDQCLTDKMRLWNKILLFNVLGRAGNTERQALTQTHTPSPSRRCHNPIPGLAFNDVDEDAPIPSVSSSSGPVSNRVIYDAVLGLQHSQNSFQRVQEEQWRDVYQRIDTIHEDLLVVHE